MESIAGHNRLLLELHRGWQCLEPTTFQNRALSLFSEGLSLDGIVLARGTAQPNIGAVRLHDVTAWGQTGTETDVLRQRPSADEPLKAALALPNRAILNPAQDAQSNLSGRCEEAQAPMERLCYAAHEPIAGLFCFVTGTRAGRAFGERDTALYELSVPHLALAMRLNAVWFARRSRRGQGERIDPAAICDRHGRLHDADELFIAELCKELPSWRGPDLPFDFHGGVGKGRAVYLGERFDAIAHPLRRGKLYLTLRAASTLERLTPRQSLVAELLAEGQSYKRIAEHLGITPYTVTKHANAIYAKLHVASKTELARYWAQRMSA